MDTSLQAPHAATIGRSAHCLGLIDGILAALHGIRVIWSRLRVDSGSGPLPSRCRCSVSARGMDKGSLPRLCELPWTG